MDLKALLSKRIKEFRRVRGYTQASLAERLGCSHSTIRDYENLVSFPGPEMIDAISQALGVDPSELFKSERVVRYSKPSDVFGALSSVPDSVYEMAEKFGRDHVVWKSVMVILEDALLEESRERQKNKKNMA